MGSQAGWAGEKSIVSASQIQILPLGNAQVHTSNADIERKEMKRQLARVPVERKGQILNQAIRK